MTIPKLGLSVLMMSLTISSCKLDPYVFNTDTAEIINSSGKVYSCHDEKLKEFACFDRESLNRINKCFKRSGGDR